jgi:hypothetical protein
MNTVFANATRGGKYQIQLQVTGPDDIFHGTYQVVELTSGNQTGFANLGQINARVAVAEYNRRIDLAAKYDGIFYIRDLKALLSGVI